MMTPELLKALQLIKEECSKYSVQCENCPLQTSRGYCGVQNEPPADWNLEKREVYF